jgi:hypothetical protein
MGRSTTIRRSEKSPRSPSAQLEAFLGKYDPPIAALARAALRRMRRLVPGAVQLVYDNYNALVIGFCPSERASEGVLSIVIYPRYVSVAFLQAVPSRLPDPAGLLQGSGKLVRHIRLEAAADLDRPEVVQLVRAACVKAKVPIGDGGRRQLIIRSVSPKQRPRRPRAAR